MIKNIVFDIGQVLAEFRWEAYIKEFGFDHAINERIAQATVLSSYWKEVDRGVMSMEEVIEGCVASDKEIEDEIRLFFKDRSKLVVEFEYATPLVKKLKDRGYQIYLLSNYGEENFSYVKDVFGFMPYVDGGIISYQVKKIKPEPGIYEDLIRTYQINPEESVFLDDLKENIRTAKSLGFYGVVFESLETALEQLKQLGVNV